MVNASEVLEMTPRAEIKVLREMLKKPQFSAGFPSYRDKTMAAEIVAPTDTSKAPNSRAQDERKGGRLGVKVEPVKSFWSTRMSGGGAAAKFVMVSSEFSLP